MTRWGCLALRAVALAWIAAGLAGCVTPSHAPPLVAVAAPDGAPPPAEESAQPPPATVSLARAVHECVAHNLRLRAGAETVRQAETDLLGASLIPNPTLLPDSQLNPFTRFSPTRQGGPPEIDVMLALPIDWLVYGKRLAAMEAARLGVDAVTADFADQVRLQVLAAVVAFFDAAEARELLRLARENLDEVTTLQEQTRKDAAAGKAEAHEVERLGLAVLDARREVRDRAEVSLRAGAALRPLLGREGNGPVPEVAGGLDAVQVGPAVDVEAVVALAEARRPDLVAARIQCDQAAAAVRSEQTRGWPALTVAPGFTYQRQQSVIGFPAARSWDVYVNAGLPLFDRNQGGVAKAESVRRQRLWSLAADRLDLRAEVE